jgi:integrase
VPLKIIAARNAKTKNLYIRGSYLGVTVDASCRTDRRSVAHAMLKRLEGAIERGEYPPKEAAVSSEQPTFLSAAVAYMESGHRRKYVAKLIKHFGDTPLSEIDQAAVDAAAVAIHPHAGPGTRNACVYTPMSAILHHAGIEIKLRRPRGAKGRVVTDWLTQDDAFGIIEAAERFDGEYALLLKFLLYTGVRLGAALNLQREDVQSDQRMAWIRHQKGQPASNVLLREDLRDALVEHLRDHNRQRVFRFHQGGHLRHLLLRAKLGYLGIYCPARRTGEWRPSAYRLSWVNHHTFRHTWATWMRQAGVDVLGLVATGNWRDPKTAARYAHAVPRDEWGKVDRLPSLGKTRGPRAS